MSQGARELVEHFQRLDLGTDTSAPGRALSTSAFRNAVNLSAIDGALECRPGSLPSQTGTFSASYTPHAQAPLAMFQAIQGVSPPNNAAAYLWVATSAELHAVRLATGTWTNVTPTYNTGTISITTGTTAVTGTGTTWLTRRVYPGGYIQIAGAWWPIASVGGEGAITLGVTYTGATQTNVAYTVRRGWWGFHVNGRGLIIRNRSFELLLANAAESGGGFQILRGATALSAGPSATWDYIVSGTGFGEEQPGLDQIDLVSCECFEVLPDGRLMVVGSDTSGRGHALYFSDHQTITTWVGGTAGVIEDISGGSSTTGGLASGWLGQSLALHYPDGITMIEMTGRLPPVLLRRAPGSYVGAASSGVIQSTERGQLFLGLNRRLCWFTGSGTELVQTGHDRLLRELNYEEMRGAWSMLDRSRDRYLLFIPKIRVSAGSNVTRKTDVLVFNRSGTVERWSMNDKVEVGTSLVPGSFALGAFAAAATTGGSETRVAIVGVPSNDPSGSTSTPVIPIRLLVETRTDDLTWPAHGNQAAVEAPSFDTDDLLFGFEGSKTLTSVVLWLSSRSGSISRTVTVSVSRDSGVTWTSLGAKALALTESWTRERWVADPGATGAGEAWRIRVALVASESGRPRLWAMKATAVPAGDLDRGAV